MNRRHFLYCTLGTAGLAGLGAAGWKLRGAANLKKVSRSSQALGTQVHLTVYAESRSQGERAIDAALAAIDRVEDVMSLYRDDSEIKRLNRVGALENPSPELLEVLQFANQLSKDSDGAFDVTVQPLWELYTKNALPSPTELAEAHKHVGWQKMAIESHGVLLSDGAQITLNGIAQGYAADAARAALADHGIEQAILDTGEVSSVGQHVEREHWTVGIKHPRESGLLGTAQLDGRCLATSGDYESTFGGNHDSHHLFDPATGSSANACASVSVAAPTAMEADALSTACFVLGVERGMKFIESKAGIDALFVAKDGQITRSTNFPLT